MRIQQILLLICGKCPEARQGLKSVSSLAHDIGLTVKLQSNCRDCDYCAEAEPERQISFSRSWDLQINCPLGERDRVCFRGGGGGLLLFNVQIL